MHIRNCRGINIDERKKTLVKIAKKSKTKLLKCTI